MFDISKNAILFLLFLGVNNLYCMPDDDNLYPTTKTLEELALRQASANRQDNREDEIIINEYSLVKNEKKCYLSRKNLSLLGFFGLCAGFNVGIAFLSKLIIGGMKNAPNSTRNEVLKLARKMKIKNPEKIKVKVMNGNSYNGASDIFGHVILTKKTNDNIRNNIGQFIAAHELSHFTNNDTWKNFLISKTCALNLFFMLKKLNAFEYFQKIFGAPEKKKHILPIYQPSKKEKGEQEKKKKKSLFMESIGHFTNFQTAAFISDVIIANTIGRYFEKRSDLAAASLGKSIAQGGINLFTSIKKKHKIIPVTHAGQFNYLKKWLTDPHPSPATRIKYLKNSIKNAQKGGKTLLKKLLRL